MYDLNSLCALKTNYSSAFCLRRTKTHKLDGKPLIELPPKEIFHELIEFSQPEREFYDALFERAQMQFNIYVRAGTVMKNYSNVLAWLMRLRQAWYAF